MSLEFQNDEAFENVNDNFKKISQNKDEMVQNVRHYVSFFKHLKCWNHNTTNVGIAKPCSLPKDNLLHIPIAFLQSAGGTMLNINTTYYNGTSKRDHLQLSASPNWKIDKTFVINVWVILICILFSSVPLIQVCYIDFGNEAIVKVKEVRKLIPSFMVLTPQAVEVFLANVDLEPSVLKDETLLKEATYVLLFFLRFGGKLLLQRNF